MKGLCPHCDREIDLEYVSTKETIEIKGESIEVPSTYLRCTECGNTFDDPHSSHDPIDLAYREYRTRHGLLQPEEIKRFRQSLGLTQRELTTILGWGGATISRYENGSLQDEPHDRLLRLAMDPRNLLSLIEKTSQGLAPHRATSILQQIKAELASTQLSVSALCEQLASLYEPDEFSGYTEFSLDKLNAAILFFSSRAGVFKTKLNKLLFYADFIHFRTFTTAITGARYAHLPYGPAPDHYDLFLTALLEDRRSLSTEEREFPDYTGELLVANEHADLSAFTPAELHTITGVFSAFAGVSATRLSKLSHRELGYRETSAGELISYQYADSLSVRLPPDGSDVGA